MRITEGAEPSEGPKHGFGQLIHTPTGSNLGWTVVGLLVGLLGFAVATAWALNSYLGIDVPGSLSFRGEDGWCPTPQDGLGVHCWGDYAAIRFESLTASPAQPEAVYPISARIVRFPFWSMDKMVGYRPSLLVFLAVSAASALAPAIWAALRLRWTQKPIVWTAIGMASLPVLILIDRGNVLAVCVPLLLAYLLALIKDKPWWAVASLVAMTTVKPQFAILGALLVTYRYWRPAVVAASASIAAVLLPFALVGSVPVATQAWLSAAFDWSQDHALSSSWPPNLSIARFLYLLSSVGGVDPGRSDSLLTRLAQGLCGVALVALMVFGNRISPLIAMSAVSALTCLAMPVSWGYYAAFALPVAALSFRFNWKPTRQDTIGRALDVLLVLALLMSLSPLLLPVGDPVYDPSVAATYRIGLLQLLIAPAWLALIVLAATSAILTRSSTGIDGRHG